MRLEPSASARHYEELLEGLSEHCKDRIEGFESIFQQVMRFRVENEAMEKEKPIEEH